MMQGPVRHAADARPVMRTAPGRGWRIAALVLFCLAGLLALLTFRDYAVSNDEWVQHTYGEKLVRFYLSGLSDRSVFAYRDLFFYGGLFDLLAIGLERVLPLPIHETRHLLSAAFGIAGLIGVYCCGRLLFGARAGFLAALALALTGPWWGGMFNHTKDVTFAVTMLWAVWALCRIAIELPRPRWGSVLAFGLFLGLSLGLRVAALVLPFYLAITLLAWFVLGSAGNAIGQRSRLAATALLRLMPAGVLAYGLMAVLWPWAVLEPRNPLVAIAWFSDLDLGIQTILDGQIFAINEVPRSYLPAYLAIKLPPIFLLGLVIAAACLILRTMAGKGAGAGRAHPIAIGALVLAAVFPVGYFVAAKPPAYDGIRHFLFVVPPLAVLAGAGLDRLLAAAVRLPPAAALLGPGLVALLALVQAGRLVLLHPHQYVDYNPLVGGLKGAHDRYVMDYWANSVPEATRALAAYVRAAYGEAPPTFKVYVCADRWTFEAAAPSFLVRVRLVEDADFFIAPTHMNCDTPPDWPRSLLRGKIIHEVVRLGTVLAVVKDRRAGP